MLKSDFRFFDGLKVRSLVLDNILESSVDRLGSSYQCDNANVVDCTEVEVGRIATIDNFTSVVEFSTLTQELAVNRFQLTINL